MSSKNFKVLIAGGSIAGLTLANMLEKIGIDYLILEKCHEMAPQVGASIGILPNGNRILDQIDLYDDIAALLVDGPNRYGSMLGPDGLVISEYNGVGEQVLKRHGSGTIFVDRQMILEVFWKKLKNKSKILVGKAVKTVELEPTGVKVTTTDGSSYSGDVLIGADGIHSTVRQEMWRLADLLEPGYIPASEHTESLPCDYKCIFGISVLKGWKPSATQTHINNGFSYITISGPGNRVYWFLFVRMDKTYHHPNLPRFSEDDEALLVKEHSDDKLSERHTFQDLYDAKTSSVLTPIPGYVFKKWHFNRIMTIGDAAHKYDPISGQGGNSAIETTAVLVNNITHMLATHPGGVSTADIHACFAKTQEKRQPRVKQLCQNSIDEQKFASVATPVRDAAVKVLLPYINFDVMLDKRSNDIEDAHRLDMLPVPKRPTAIPFYDELPAYPLASGKLAKIIAATALLAIFFAAQWFMKIDLEAFSATGTFWGQPLKRTFTGIPQIDSTLSRLVCGLSGFVSGSNATMKLQCFYFLANILPMVYIMTVEGYRNGNHLALVSMPVVFGIAYQLFGIGMVAPLYFLLSMYTGSRKIYTRTTGRAIHSTVAKGLLPAVLLGYVIPALAMFIPHDSNISKQNTIAFWLASPVYVAGLTWVFSRVVERISSKPTASLDWELFGNKDLVPLQAGYAMVIAATTATHLCSILYARSNASVSLVPTVGAVGENGGIYDWFKYNMVLYFAAILVWCLYSVFELRRLGYVTTEKAMKAAVAVLVGQVTVGPGATYAGLWAWREDVIASLVMDGK